MKHTILLLYVFCCHLLQGVDCFLVVSKGSPRAILQLVRGPKVTLPSFSSSPGGTVLYRSKNSRDLEGRSGGIPLLIASFIVSAWFFTIDPQIRRTHLCTSPRCVEDREYCYDCKTFGEFKEMILDYYRYGGGIKWDFSIEPK
jgi:hypothetical protein